MHTYQYLLLLAATTALAAPIPQRDAHRIAARETDLDLSSHTRNAVTDHAADAPVNFALPPLDVVFAIMKTEHPDSDSASSSSTTASATAGAHTIEMGPGLWLAPSPTPPDRTEPTVSASPDSHDAPPVLEHKGLFVSIVILSMIALVLALYACSYHRHKRPLTSRVPLDEKALKDRKALGEKKEQENEKKRSRSTSVVNITRNFPRSKFSVSTRASSFSDSSSSSESVSTEASGSDCDSDESLESYERGAMDSAHFFALRASSTSSNNRHSRIGSEPAFGIPRYNARRAGRRSRSVSGPRESEEWA
ncbi:hypothetical protein B0H16DRAFT_1611877 [Mycena metata]|uniref:Uncharacterized protein n=1 Tax=Mycena metata TaxID=1033252 RepID=A0AAD7HC79_9AGAR|nr:hypothetical protein B0H16DRAFT_1611877 [Mycena metata]